MECIGGRVDLIAFGQDFLNCIYYCGGVHMLQCTYEGLRTAMWVSALLQLLHR